MQHNAGPQNPGHDRQWVRLLLAGLAALLVIRVGALAANGTDLFFDEAQYWFWSTQPAFGYYSKPPLIAWLIGISTATCGDSEFCIRLPSPILHTLTSLVVYALARRLYDVQTGVLAGLAFATLPGVSVSAGIMSTDVPLLLFWALSLLGLVWLMEQKDEPGDWRPSLLLGTSLGLGLNAKYAMAWFLACLVVYLLATPQRRWLLRDRRLYAALGLALLVISPNLVWNMGNDLATFSHTADNAKWGGSLFHPGKALEFFGAQFGVFGPILFGSLLIIAVRAAREPLPEADRLLLAFCLPLIAAITLQAFLSRAHANWAAPAYVAASALVMATMVRDVASRWMRASFAVHALVLIAAVVGVALAGRYALPLARDPFARTLGWQALAQATRDELQKARAAGRPFAAVLTDDRPVTAELLYYLRDETTPIYAWRDGPHARDHFELVRPFVPAGNAPVLLVSLIGSDGPIVSRFVDAETIATRDIPAGPLESRRAVFVALSGLKNPG
ncbi:MAG: glycosyltransferase family 39 protein [Hyphomicrobiaceae bacterium]|nr:glycosyltransferase family 39 protein [Hyphomicrobiaceae bacterium]